MPSSISWPEGLRAPIRESYSVVQRPAALTTTFGPVTVARQLYSDSPADLTAEWVFNQLQFKTLLGFYWHELLAGTRSFNMPLLVGGEDLGLVEVSFQGRMYDAARLVGLQHWRVSAQLTTRTGIQMSAAEWAIWNS